MSYDSWSDLGENAEVCEDARNALSQIQDGAMIVASSDPIKDDENDPPCIRAKREYVSIANDDDAFKCTGEYPSEQSPDVIEFEIDSDGPRLLTALMGGVAAPGIIGRQPLSHG